MSGWIEPFPPQGAEGDSPSLFDTIAATPLGDTVRATATLIAVEGRRLTFTLSAHDSTEAIGEGRHERAIVARNRFMERLATKRKAL